MIIFKWYGQKLFETDPSLIYLILQGESAALETSLKLFFILLLKERWETLRDEEIDLPLSFFFSLEQLQSTDSLQNLSQDLVNLELFS